MKVWIVEGIVDDDPSIICGFTSRESCEQFMSECQDFENDLLTAKYNDGFQAWKDMMVNHPNGQGEYYDTYQSTCVEIR